jgi:hypothetical protein
MTLTRPARQLRMSLRGQAAAALHAREALARFQKGTYTKEQDQDWIEAFLALLTLQAQLLQGPSDLSQGHTATAELIYKEVASRQAEFDISLPGSTTDQLVSVEEVSRRLEELIGIGADEIDQELLKQYMRLLLVVSGQLSGLAEEAARAQ